MKNRQSLFEPIPYNCFPVTLLLKTSSSTKTAGWSSHNGNKNVAGDKIIQLIQDITGGNMTVEIYYFSVCENKQFHGQCFYRLGAHLSRKRHCKAHLSSHFWRKVFLELLHLSIKILLKLKKKY